MRRENDKVGCGAYVFLWILMIAAAALLIRDYRQGRRTMKEEHTRTISTIYLPFDSTYLDSNGHLKLKIELVRDERK